MFILVDFGGPFYHLLFTAFCADKNYNYCQCLLVFMSKLYINFFCSPRCGCWPGSGRRLNSGGHGLRHPVQTRHLWWSNQVKQGVVIFMENKAVHKNVYSILQCVYIFIDLFFFHSAEIVVCCSSVILCLWITQISSWLPMNMTPIK